MIELTTMVCRRDPVVGSELDGEMMMLNIDTGTYHGLNRVGTQIWAALMAPVAVERLCQQVAAAFAVSMQQCEQDVIRFVERLVDRGLAEVVPAS